MFKINLLIFSNNSYFLVRFNKPISINVIKLMKRKLLHRVFIPFLPQKYVHLYIFTFRKISLCIASDQIFNIHVHIHIYHNINRVTRREMCDVLIIKCCICLKVSGCVQFSLGI